jgi:hypothetical protein
MAPLARSRLRAEHEISNLFDDSPLVVDILLNNPPDCLVARQHRKPGAGFGRSFSLMAAS